MATNTWNAMLVGLLVSACSRAPKSRALYDVHAGPNGRPSDAACFDHFGQRRFDPDSSLPGRPVVVKMLCGLIGEHDSMVGVGTIVFREPEENDELVICGFHLLPTRLSGPLSFEQTIFPIKDPTIAFELRGLIAGIDPHREFRRVMDFNGIHIDFEQFVPTHLPAELQENMPAFVKAPYIELDINGCNPSPPNHRDVMDHRDVVVTDGEPIHFDSDR